MSDMRGPRQSIYFVGHHEKAITDDLAWDLVSAFRPGRQPLSEDRLMTPREENEAFERWKDSPEGFQNTALYYPRPQQMGGKPSSNQVEIGIDLRPFHKWRFRPSEVVHIPLFEREKGRWFMVLAGGRRIDYDNPFEMTWFLDKVHLTLPLLEPDFAFADVGSRALGRIGNEPRRRAWPILLYGPQMVEKMGGRERLLEAPAWRVEELSNGAIWIQVAENPFTALPEELARLASYLGLQGPG